MASVGFGCRQRIIPHHLLDPGGEKLCLEKILSLAFYGDMEDALLELLWNTRDDVPVESGIAYLLDRGRALEAKALFTRAKTEGRLADDHAAKLIERLRESLARLPASQTAFAMDGDVSRKTNGALPRALVVEDAASFCRSLPPHPRAEGLLPPPS